MQLAKERKEKAINYKVTMPDDKSIYLSFIYHRVIDSSKNWDSKSFAQKYDKVNYMLNLDMREIDRMYDLEISLEEISNVVWGALRSIDLHVDEIHIDFI